MKKKHLLNMKKTLSVFMAVMMLLTAWVFVAPTEASAVTAVEYPVQVKFSHSGSPSGHIVVYYFDVDENGNVDTSNKNQSTTIISSISGAGYGSSGTHTTTPINVPGWPWKVEITAQSGTTIRMLGFYIGEIEVTGMVANSNEGYNIKGKITKSWAYDSDANLSSGSIAKKNWDLPTWENSQTMSGVSVDVPSVGSRDVAWSTQASWEDQYGVSWPQDKVTYSYSATGVTVDCSNGKITGASVNSSAIQNITSGSSKNVTVTASGAGQTQTANITLNAPKKDVTFENMFSVSAWKNSASAEVSNTNAQLTVNDDTGFIRIWKGVADDVYSSCSNGDHDANKYSVSVTSGGSYTLSFDTETSQSGGEVRSQAALYWFDINGYSVGSPTVLDFSGDSERHTAEITVPSDARQVEFRFGNRCTTSGSTVYFKNIAFYPTERGTEYGIEEWTTRPVTKAYTYNAALGATLPVPARNGYTFNGWYLDGNVTADGKPQDGEWVTDGNGTVVSETQSFKIASHYNLYADWSASDYTAAFDGNGGTASSTSLGYTIIGTVKLPTATRSGYEFDCWKVTAASGNWKVGDTYSAGEILTGMYGDVTLTAQWTKTWTVTFLKADGTTFVTRTVRNGEAAEAPAQNPTKASDDNGKYTFTGWDVDFTNVTSDLTVTPQFTSTPHGNFTYSLVSLATCTKNAIVTKRCGDCNYSYGNVEYNGTEREDWLATDHDFTGETIKKGSYIGDANNQTDTDTHVRKCKNCTETITETHENSWYILKTEGATCTTPGTVYWECPCGAQKTTQGDTAPNVHNFDGTVITPKGDGTHDVHCTYDISHTTNVKCTDANNDCICDVAACGQELVHVYDQKTEDEEYEKTPATCTDDAVYYYACKCGKKSNTEFWTAEGSATGHTWLNEGTDLATPAECEKDATYYQTCEKCGISARDETGSTWTAVGSATGHNYTGTVIRDNENGTHSYSCVNGCSTYGYNKVKDAGKDCTYGDWSTTEADTHTKTCSECYYEVTEEHNWSVWTPTEPNKEEDGEQTRTCSVCKKVETKACDYEETHKAATCTDPEITTYKCKDCGHGYTVTGKAATGHDYTDTADVKSNSGSHSYGCTKCDTYGYDGIQNAAEPCDYGYTKTTDGQHKATCKVCNYSFTENCVAAEGKEATCSALAVCGKCEKEFGGYAAHSFTAEGGAVALGNGKHAYRCENCKDETKYGIGANVGAYQDCSGGEATCSAPAECEVCGQAYGSVNANAHVWGDWANVEGTETHKRVCTLNGTHTQTQDCLCTSPTATSPDCNTPSYTYNTCDDCGYEWQTANDDALGHDWSSAWVSDGKGNHTKTCARGCSYADNTLTEACADAEPVVHEATCTEDGYTAYICDGCSYEWEGNTVSATGHSYANKNQSEAEEYKRSDKSCTTDLTYWYVCDNCDASAEADAESGKFELTDLYWMPAGGEQTGHSFDEECDKYPASPATCTEKATYYYSCSNEGCNEKGTETYEAGEALGHDWVKPADEELEDYNVVEADCVNDATYYYVCKRCDVSSQGNKADGETWTDVGSKLGHDFDHDDDGELKDEGDTGYTAYKAADCFEEGSLEHWTCERCAKKFSDKDDNGSELTDTVLVKRNHALVTAYGKSATCEEPGYTKHKMCSHNGCTYRDADYQVIPATGHEFLAEKGYYADAENGCHAYKCTNCDVYGVGDVKYEVADGVVKGAVECTFSGEYVNFDDENGVHYHKQLCVCGNEESTVCTAAETEKVDVTCTEDGYYKYTCACGFEWTETSEDEADKAQGHSLKIKSNGDGTHTEYCENCDYVKATEKCSTEKPSAACGEQEICDDCKAAYGDPVAHSFTVYVHDENSEKCQIDGTKTAKCDNCDATDTVTDEGTALDHKMTDWTYDLSGWTNMPADFDKDSIVEPTCHTAGKQIKYCTNEGCAYYETQTVKADSTLHQWAVDADGKELWTIVSGDCGTGVTLENECTVEGCNEVRTKTEEAGHSWVVIKYIAPTCEKNGYRELRCEVCHQTEDRYYSEAKHEELGDEYEDADLEKTGEHTLVFISETPATCAKNAYITEKCITCNGYFITETEGTILEHNLVAYKGVAATCEEAGYTDYQKCSDCGTVVGKTEIPATGHGELDENGKCKDCGRVVYDSENGKSCGCICHKESGLMKLLYKILNFFWKLFKISKTCSCGNVHW